MEPTVEVVVDARRMKGLEVCTVLVTSSKEKATEGREEASDITGEAELRVV